MTFGYFLLGLYAGRSQLFTAIGRNKKRFLKWNQAMKHSVFLLLLIGLLMSLNDIVTIPGIQVVPK